MSRSDALFALSLLELEDVGRVTAARLLRHFDDFDGIRAFPREQLLHRISGVPRGEQIVQRLHEPDQVAEAVDRAEQRLSILEDKDVQILVQHRNGYPEPLYDLDRGERPVHLFLYGSAGRIRDRTLGLFGSAPLPDPAFEAAQELGDRLRPTGAIPVTGLQGGFDKVIQERAAGREGGHPSVILLGCGLGRLPRPLRPVATQALRAGSLLVSPFPMQHGPFDHDQKERAVLQAALSTASFFAAPQPNTPEWHALSWAAVHRRAFVWPEPGPELPDGAVPIEDRSELGRVLEAVS